MTTKLLTDVYRHNTESHYRYITPDPLDDNWYYYLHVEPNHPEVSYSNMCRSRNFGLVRTSYSPTGIGWVPTDVNFLNDYPELFI